MATQIEFFYLIHNISTKDNYIIRQSFAPDIFVRRSDLNHQLTLAFFNNQVWQEKWAQIIKNRSLGGPAKDSFMIWSFFMPCVFSSATKISIKIFDQFFACIINFDKCMKLISTSISTLFNSAYIKASFAINKARKVCNLFLGVISTKNSWFCHKSSFFYYYTIVNELTKYVQPERLNERAPLMGDAIV